MYELLKVLVKCFHRLQPKAECMRRDVYDIVVIHNVSSTQSNMQNYVRMLHICFVIKMFVISTFLV